MNQIPASAELYTIGCDLDNFGIPREYPGSATPCTVRERVNILIRLCQAKGIEWIPEQENKHV